MSFLRRLFGGREPDEDDGGRRSTLDAAAKEAADEVADAAAEEAAEHERNLALLRAENERLDDFRQRQLRWGRHAWQPPRQGGERRADDTDAEDAED